VQLSNTLHVPSVAKYGIGFLITMEGEHLQYFLHAQCVKKSTKYRKNNTESQGRFRKNISNVLRIISDSPSQVKVVALSIIPVSGS
jgi:hypothetical protein